MAPRHIKAEMVRQGISQQRIARRLGVGRSMINHVIAGRTRSLRVENAIARALNIPRTELFGRRMRAA